MPASMSSCGRVEHVVLCGKNRVSTHALRTLRDASHVACYVIAVKGNVHRLLSTVGAIDNRPISRRPLEGSSTRPNERGFRCAPCDGPLFGRPRAAPFGVRRRRRSPFIAALVERAPAHALAVAGPGAAERGTQLGRALTRFYRLRRNPRLDEPWLTAPRLPLLGRGQPRRIALDWTEWPQNLRMLVAAVGVGCRALPVQAACSTIDIPRSQNLRETPWVRFLGHPWRPVEHAAMGLWDRGCRRPGISIRGRPSTWGWSTCARIELCRYASWASGPPTNEGSGG